MGKASKAKNKERGTYIETIVHNVRTNGLMPHDMTENELRRKLCLEETPRLRALSFDPEDLFGSYVRRNVEVRPRRNWRECIGIENLLVVLAR